MVNDFVENVWTTNSVDLNVISVTGKWLLYWWQMFEAYN